MNRVAAVVKIYARDRYGWIYLPWIILGSSFLVNLIIAFLAPEQIKTGGLASIYIYLLVAGIVSIAQTFPFAISFTVRRKDYMLGTIATMAGLSAVFAILLVLLAKLEADWFSGWGVDLTFFSFSYLTEGGLLGQWWVHFGYMMHLFMLGFLIGSIYRRVGRNGLFFVFIVLALVLMIAGYLIGYYEYWDNIGRWLRDDSPTAVQLSWYLLPLTIVYGLIAYGLLRRATV